MSSYLGTSAGGRPYGTFVDRAMNPIMRQGAMDANCAFDIGAMIATQTENKTIGPSAYGGSENRQVYDIAPHDICFTVPGKQGTLGDTRFQVLSALNGLGAEATQNFMNDPDGKELVRLCVKNQIQYAGVAIEFLSSERGQFERGVAVQLAGLNTLYMGNGKHGPNQSNDNTVRPGDLLCVDLPTPDRAGLSPGEGGRYRPGVPRSKFVLQVRRCNVQSPVKFVRLFFLLVWFNSFFACLRACAQAQGRAAQLHILTLLRSRSKWRQSMGEFACNTRNWASAAKNIMDSYTAGVVLGSAELLNAGVFLLNPALIALLPRAGDRGAINDMNDLAGGGDGWNPAQSDESKRAMRHGANIASEVVAEFLGIIPTRAYSNNGGNALVAVRKLRHQIPSRIFHDGKTVLYEAGYEAAENGGVAHFRGRFAATGVVDSSVPAGALLGVQLNHFLRAMGGFHAAVLEELRFAIGKATTGARAEGSGKMHVALGICRS